MPLIRVLSLSTFFGILGCGEVSDLRSKGSDALQSRNSAQQLGDEGAFYDDADAVDQDLKDDTDAESDGAEGDSGSDDGGIKDLAMDDSDGEEVHNDTAVLQTVKSSVTGSPHQGPGQSPFQGGLEESQEPLAIIDVNYTGAGCPNGSVATNVSDDEQAFTILFSDFFVEYLGPKGPAPEKHCRVSLTLDVPHGYQISVLSTDLRGFADLNGDQVAVFYSDYAFDSRTPASFTDTIDGPTGIAGDFEINHDLDIETWVWSACGATYELDVDLTVSIDSPTSDEHAVVTVDSLDGEMTHKMGLAWRACG